MGYHPPYEFSACVASVCIPTQEHRNEIKKKREHNLTNPALKHRFPILPDNNSIQLPKHLHLRQIKPQIKLQLMVPGSHMVAKIVKGLVVLPLFEMGQLVDRDHP